MKRTRPERPSGRPKVKERKNCLKCGRGLMKRHGLTHKGITYWRCNKCRMTYQYKFGILDQIGRQAIEEWWMVDAWYKIGRMLVVYGGET